MEFSPVLWTEEPTPFKEVSCTTCGLYIQGTRMVWGEGNPNAPVMMILDNPGAREDHEGNPVVCGTRQTLQQAIHDVDLKENLFYITYILKRRPIKKYDKEATRRICMQRHLYKQLEVHKPKAIICLGNIAVQSFFENEDVNVKKLRGKWYDVRGFQTTVAYHPLGVRRRPNLYKLLKEDLMLLKDIDLG